MGAVATGWLERFSKDRVACRVLERREYAGGRDKTGRGALGLSAARGAESNTIARRMGVFRSATTTSTDRLQNQRKTNSSGTLLQCCRRTGGTSYGNSLGLLLCS